VWEITTFGRDRSVPKAPLHISLAKVEVMSHGWHVSEGCDPVERRRGGVGAGRQLGRMIPSHCAADETSCVSTWCLTKVFTANPEGAARICR
jgi:hypothetical protein